MVTHNRQESSGDTKPQQKTGPVLQAWLASQASHGQIDWEPIEDRWQNDGGSDLVMKLVAAIPPLPTACKKLTARKEVAGHTEKTRAPRHEGSEDQGECRKRSESSKEGSEVTPTEKRWCDKSEQVVNGPRTTFLSVCRGRNIENLSE